MDRPAPGRVTTVAATTLPAAALPRTLRWMRTEPSTPLTVDGACSGLPTVIRLGPVCEIIANGQYFWLPLESCQGVSVDHPQLRDLVWASGEVLLPNEGQVPVLVPARYQHDPSHGRQCGSVEAIACY